MLKKPRQYAMYKGDEFLCMGTREEICEQMNIKLPTFQFYRTNYYKNVRATHLNNRRIIIKLDGQDRIYGDLQ